MKQEVGNRNSRNQMKISTVLKPAREAKNQCSCFS